MASIAPTIIDSDLDFTVRTDDDIVIIGGLVDMIDGEWHLTPAEARTLAGHILAAVDVADGVR